MSDQSERIEELLRQGRKLEAIKLFSEATGVDLSTAKKEIERIAEAMAAEESGVAPTRSLETSDDSIPDDILALVRSGNKIEAIKQLRNRTGLGLKEAKDRIDAVDGTTSTGRGSCLGGIVLLVGGAMLALLMG